MSEEVILMVSIVAAILGIALVVAWILFPFIVIGKFNDQIKAVRKV